MGGKGRGNGSEKSGGREGEVYNVLKELIKTKTKTQKDTYMGGGVQT